MGELHESSDYDLAEKPTPKQASSFCRRRFPDHSVRGIIDESGWQGHLELPTPGLALYAAPQAGSKDVKLRLAHRPLQPQEEAVRLSPENGLFRANLGLVHSLEGDEGEARRVMDWLDTQTDYNGCLSPGLQACGKSFRQEARRHRIRRSGDPGDVVHKTRQESRPSRVERVWFVWRINCSRRNMEASAGAGPPGPTSWTAGLMPFGRTAGPDGPLHEPKRAQPMAREYVASATFPQADHRGRCRYQHRQGGMLP